MRAILQLLVVFAFGALGCLYYDSRWGQTKTAQQNAAQHYKGAQIGDGKAGSQRLPPKQREVRQVRLVAFATPEHAAQVVNWQERLGEAITTANQLLAATLAIELQLIDGGFWRPESNPDDLEALLAELERSHPATADTEWVVGLIGALSRLEVSFHQLGVGRLHGKHLVLRAANDALEYDAIEQGYTELGSEERAALYRSRRAHQASAVLIHELGHCLGAVHVMPATDLMHATYNAEMASLDPSVAGVMRISLGQRFLPPAERNARLMVQQIVAELDRGGELWVDAEEREMRAYLATLVPEASSTPSAPPPGVSQTSPSAAAAPQSSGAAAATTPVKASSSSGLTDAEQQLYRRVLLLKEAGQIAEAVTAGEPLFRDHSDIHSIAELRCQLAMSQGGDYDVIREQCAPLLGQASGFGR